MAANPTVGNTNGNSDYKVKTAQDSSGNNIQYVIVTNESDELYATISCSSSGDNEIVAAVAGKKIKVLRYSFTASGTVNAKWKSGASTDISGLYYEVSNTGISEGYCPVGIVKTAISQALNLNLSGAVPVGGCLTYILV